VLNKRVHDASANTQFVFKLINFDGLRPSRRYNGVSSAWRGNRCCDIILAGLRDT